MSTRRQAISGSLKRLLIWVIALAVWETAYRVCQTRWVNGSRAESVWPSYIFPAPSHIIDGLTALMNLNTGFGMPLHRGWPLIPGTPLVGSINLNDAPAFLPHGLRSVWAYLLSTALLPSTWVSLVRLLIGFVISVVLGAGLGVAMWRFKSLDEFLGPLFLGLQTLPSVCWVPMAVILFGLHETGLMFVLILGSFFSVAIALRDGLQTIPPLYQRAGRMLGAGGWRLYWYVLLPASLPALASSLRQGFSFAWRSLMGAEMIMNADHDGLGRLLEYARDNSSIAQILAIMALMVMIGMAADRLIFARVERRIYTRFGLVAS